MCVMSPYRQEKGLDHGRGSNASGRPRIADLLAENLTRGEAIELVGRFMDYYRDNSNKRSRSSLFVKRVGIDAVKAAIL